VLVAKFRFYDETPPRDREDIRDRISRNNNSLSHYICQLSQLPNSGFEGSEVRSQGSNLVLTNQSQRHTIDIDYTPGIPYWTIGINITETYSQDFVNQENMLDLRAINRFILTGEESAELKEKRLESLTTS